MSFPDALYSLLVLKKKMDLYPQDALRGKWVPCGLGGYP